MKTLTIFYDPRCGLCAKFRVWLEAQPKRVAVEFLDYDSAEALRRFSDSLVLGAERDVVVLADDGRWWQGSAAWLTCLWTTVQYRDWSFRLAAPVFQPFVKKAVHLLSENRLTISRLMKLRTDAELATAIRSLPVAKCKNGVCHV
ncbi:MAG: DCC1-like thiol-disulfide oxidoreductase family protein [Luteolibacter sp.]|uniref:DCC1-like thiol-disulfide oxidoreductase family protein n=1 Tax=Luteolibacter sp. TaxID=1962973 RepID=UPI0032674331